MRIKIVFGFMAGVVMDYKGARYIHGDQACNWMLANMLKLKLQVDKPRETE